MVEPDDAAGIEEHQCRRGACAVLFEVFLAHRHGHVFQTGVDTPSHLVNVFEFFFGRRVFTAPGVAVALRRADNREPAAAVFGLQPYQRRNLHLAVGAPVSPEIQQHRAPFKRAQWNRLWPQPLSDVERRRGLAFQGQQVQILLYPGANRSAPPGLQLALEKRDCLGALAARRQNICLNFDRSAERDRQVFVVVEFAPFQLLQRELPRPGGVGFRLIELLRRQRAPPEPGVRFDHLRRDAVRPAVRLDLPLRERKVAPRDGGPHVGDNGRGGRRQLREEHQRDL